MLRAAVINNLESPDVDTDGGKFRILAELGEGGTASVYLAVARGQSGFNKLVVVKVLKRSMAEHEEMRTMFVQEARLAARLNHTGIVQTYDIAEIWGLPAIVMEYLEGQPLSRLISRAKDRLSLALHLRIIADAAGALHYAHELTDFDGKPLGLVHRDMTPHNVMVTFDGQTKLLDFGIAKLATSHNETRTGVIKGKVRYMPPEQIAGEPVDRRADVYAIGVMLWEAATRKSMWEDCTDIMVMNSVLNGEIPAPSTVAADIPPELERICLKAIAAKPDDRYATVAEIEGELEALIAQLGEPVGARQIGKLLADTFSDVRQKTRNLVEKQLSQIASLSAEEYEVLDTVPVLAGEASVTSSTNEAARAEVERMRRRRMTTRAFYLLVLTGGAALAVRSILHSRASDVGPAYTSPAGSQSAPVTSQQPAELATGATVPAATTRISVEVEATPRAARVYLDNEPLPGNPFVRLLPADGTRHILKAEADGYLPQTATILADKDAKVSLTLERARPAPVDRPRPRPAQDSTQQTSTPACDPPYVLDRNGIKKFKPECL